MIPIKEAARAICSRLSTRKMLLIYSLHCDASYDGTSNVKGTPHIPQTYVFAGFFADDITCTDLAPGKRLS